MVFHGGMKHKPFYYAHDLVGQKSGQGTEGIVCSVSQCLGPQAELSQMAGDGRNSLPGVICLGFWFFSTLYLLRLECPRWLLH